VFDGFTFHMLRHTAGSLMALAGLDPAVASERMGHTDGGALFLRTYRHLYEGEKCVQAARLETLVRTSLDKEGTTPAGGELERADKVTLKSGRTWDRTRDLPRVKGVVVSNSVSSPPLATATPSHGIEHPPAVPGEPGEP
jgi:hypothetical protein